MLAGVLLGVLGIRMARPLSAVLEVMVKALYVEDVLGNDNRPPNRRESD
jgi:hypothetical protein